ncbi:hypothetical protein, partial [uncultured Gemmiger sp.]|uniref:hypothetical protein n=1 Tax=uncultured Gemmiger sp. TaxID=1623490 RepID=UPI00262CEF71
MQKTNFKTRLLALLTAAFMLVMCVPFAAFAEETKNVTVQVRFFIDGTLTEAGDGGLVPVEAPESDLKAGKINVPEDKIPAGYEVAETKPVLTYVSVKDMWYASVYVKEKAQEPTQPETVTVKVRFIDKDTAAWLNNTLIDVEAPKSEVDAGAITIPADQIPADYEVVEQKVFNDATYGWMASVYVKKSAPVQPETVTVKVRFIDKDTAAWLNNTLIDV